MDKLILFCIGLLGVLAYSLLKLKSLKADAKSAKISFTLKDYFENDFINISLSILAVVIWTFLFEETMQTYPKIESYLRWTFLGVGGTGAFIIQKLDDRSKKYIRKVIDKKTEEYGTTFE